ncbi:2,3-bisphosphoglycerate-independent phosphoglycerate mutase, partial [Candidatus Gastranaerophilus sp. (ex Termes propinquus)]
FDMLSKNESFTKIHADGEYVGLPKGQMGNSEVGHLNIGAGRIVYQELTKINKAIEDKSFFENEEFLKATKHAKENGSALHLMGLLSDGGVHSSIEHLKELVKFAKMHGLKKVYVHAFLDGRDTPPKSAYKYIEEMESYLKEQEMPQLASIIGRYWAMDRDRRWERVEKAYNCLLGAGAGAAQNASLAIEESYKNNVTD